jgi:hypothetical protein
MRRTLIASLALALAAGCRTTPQMPVQLQGDPASLARLAGEWTGQYWGGAGGRGGSLSFSLRAGLAFVVTFFDAELGDSQQIGIDQFAEDLRSAQAVNSD